jgi:two-component system, NtrC family, nitrogen regulation sensor histidine kinase NtrY
MIYRSFNLTLVLRLVVFGTLTATLGILIMNKNWLFSVPIMILAAIATIDLVYFMNGIHRKVAFFFDAVTNEDTTLHYSESIRTKSLLALHTSLNRLNKHITEIKIRNEHNERFFREMLKYSATGLIAVNENGYIEQINDSALDIIGFPHIEHMDLLRQKNSGLYEQMVQITPGEGRTVKLLVGTELRSLSVKVSLLNFGDSHFRLYSIFDIRAELEENELDSWHKLIRVMTHEIMNSIAPITSLSNTLSRIFTRDNKPLPVNEVTEKHIVNIIHGLEVIENTGKGLMDFVEDYRKLTKIPKPVFKSIKINHWLNSIYLLLKNRFDEERIEFKLITKGAPEELIGDEKLLTQVMINLLNNAADALKTTKVREIVISVSGSSNGKTKISVSDNGMGISPEDIEKIFIPFYTTKENGSGIGLDLSRKIMRLHKGTITVFSQPEKQTTFTLIF